MNFSAQYWIQHLGLLTHPEGGFYREMYRSNESMAREALPERYTGKRSFSTSIYFLLRSEDISAFHRIKSDEIWFYHDGSPVDIYILKDGRLQTITLGKNAEKGENLQVLVPQGSWFGAKVIAQASFVLVSCTVAPGFDFDDFELAKRKELIAEYPLFEETITLLTTN